MLLVQKFNMNHTALGTLATGANIQYLCTLVYGEELSQFDLLSAVMEGTIPLTVEDIITGLALYFPPVNSL